MFGLFKKKEKQVNDSILTEADRRTYLIKDEWVHVPNCVDDTPWAEADESPNNPHRLK